MEDVFGNIFECFPGDAVVQLQDGSTKTMTQLRVSDKVLSGDGTYQDVYFFGHEKPGVAAKFVAVTLRTKETLEASHMHYLPVSLACDGTSQHMLASEVKPGM